MENYFRNFFEELKHTPKEFAVKYFKQSQNRELENTFSVTLTFDADFLSDIETEQFHTNDTYSGEVVNIGGIVHYENRKYIPRFFIKGDGKSWIDGEDSFLFHIPFGNYRECHSSNYKSVRPNNYLIEYFPLAEVIGKIRKIYINDLDKSLPFILNESFQFESMVFKYTVEFEPRNS